MNDNDLLCRRIMDKKDKLYRLAYSYMRNEQDAMDVVEDVVYKALLNGNQLNNPQYLETWLFRVTVNTALDLLRRRRRETVGLPLTDDGKNDDYSEQELNSLLETLDEKSRTVVILRFFEDLTLSQIAAVLGENTSTVKTRLYRALNTLKAELETGGTDHGKSTKTA